MSRLEILALVSAAVSITFLILGTIAKCARTGAAHAEITMPYEKDFS